MTTATRSMQWRVAVGATLLTLGSYAAMGQQSGPPPGSAEAPQQGRMERRQGPERELIQLTSVLTLTADQQTGVKALLDQQAQQMRALRNKPQSDPSTGQAAETPQARMVQMNQIRDETNTKISALLDDTQKKTFADWILKRKAEMEQRHQQDDPQPTNGSSPSSPQ